MVWMFKRLLQGLGFAHSQYSVIHGAIVPSHVLVHPVDHGAKIIDWSYALDVTPREVPEKEKGRRTVWDRLTDDDVIDQDPFVVAISGPYKAYYPAEILAKSEPTPATDIYMAAKCAIALIGGNVKTNEMSATVPKPIQAFLKKCVILRQDDRPQDAWKVCDDFKKLLETVVGKPAYRKFSLPEVSDDARRIESPA